jgi:hypothetical protein
VSTHAGSQLVGVSSTVIGPVAASAWAGTWIPVLVLIGAASAVALVRRPVPAVVVVLRTWAGR